jgi:hypothetical protein
MAYVDILSPDAYGRFNRKLAQLTSLAVAVYWSEILDISTKVLKKGKFDSNGFFKLDRKYIETRTTLKVETQLEADAVLNNLGVLESNEDDPDQIRVKLETAISILADDTFKIDRGAKKRVGASKAQQAASKKAGVISTMKGLLRETDPELLELYKGWVDSVYAGKWFLTKTIIYDFEDAINKYTSDKKVKESLLHIAVQTGYREFEWIKGRYEQNRNSTNITKLADQKISMGVKTDVNF